MKKVLIIGAGFAGLSAAERLSRCKDGLKLILIDAKPVSDFLPLLPDCIGRGLNARSLSFEIAGFCRKRGLDFLNAQVSAVDLQARQVVAGGERLGYDCLLIASGSQTNFYGNKELESAAFKLDDAADARRINIALAEREFDSYIVCGGGYTGIEAATNLRLYLNKKKKDKRVAIMERAPAILGPLPQWMKEYVRSNLKKMNIEVSLNTSIDKIDTRTMLIWAAGVRAADFIQALNAGKNPQGRIKVDKYLSLNDSCFVAGDAAWFAHQGSFLRMAVQFAIMQGRLAAENIIRSIRGARLREFKPLDLGYVIPMANNHSCGNALGVNTRGRLPTLLHYLMCTYRLRSWKNKFAILKGLVKGG